VHYKTLVIGPSVEAQLEPFDEAIVVAPYVDEHGETTTASPDARFDWRQGSRRCPKWDTCRSDRRYRRQAVGDRRRLVACAGPHRRNRG
jgi:hypothetical protein